MSAPASVERAAESPALGRRLNLLAGIFILFFLVINALSVQEKYWTMDEPNHLLYGQNILNGESNRIDDSKMPVSVWNALPGKIASYLPGGLFKLYLQKLIVARWMTTLFSAAIAFAVFHWSRKLYGRVPALVSLGLYVFDPNIIAHSQLVTTDVYVTGMILLCSYWLWKFADSRHWRDGLVFAVLLGTAQLAKYTAFSLYPLFAIALLVHDWPRLREMVKVEGRPGIARQVGRYLAYLLVVATVSLVMINIGFLFNRTFTPLKDYRFKSEMFQTLQSRLAFMGNAPVPTPYPYLEGLDWITFKERSGVGFGRVYLLGETRYGRGFAGYYLVASFLKVPLATQVILLAALVVYFGRKRGTFLKDELFLLWLVFFYTIYFNFLYNAQIGIRFYLVVFPLLYVFAGGLFANWRGFSLTQKAATSVLALYLAASVLSYYPNYLAYFNEVVWDRKMAYLYLADSNIDWGQDLNVLKTYLAGHPEVSKAPEVPHRLKKTHTYFALIDQLVGVIYYPSTYQWLRENFRPVGRIAPSYLLYEITPEQMQALCDRTDYCR